MFVSESPLRIAHLLFKSAYYVRFYLGRAISVLFNNKRNVSELCKDDNNNIFLIYREVTFYYLRFNHFKFVYVQIELKDKQNLLPNYPPLICRG